MKRMLTLIVVLVMAFSFAGCDACKENVGDKVGDFFATIGKDGVDKDKVLAERKSERASACAQQKGAEMKKKMGL